MNDKYSFLLCSCDNYSDLWDPFFTLLTRYWKGFDYEVYLCTESKKYTFPGLNIHCPLNVPQTNTWSQNLIDTLHSIPTEYIIFMLDDFWLKSPVNTERLEMLMARFDADKRMGNLLLLHQSASSLQPSAQYPDLVKFPARRPYRISTQVSLYRKDYLLKVLRPHETAWRFEVFGTKRSARLPFDNWIIADGTPPMFDYDRGGVVYRRSYVKEFVDYFVEKEGIAVDPSRRVDRMDVLVEEYHRNHKPTLRGLIDTIRSQF